MSSQEIWIVKIACFIIAGLFSLAAAIFNFSQEHIGENHPGVKEWFAEKWVTLSESRYRHLPRKTISHFVISLNNFIEYFNTVFVIEKHGKLWAILGAWMIVGFIASNFLYAKLLYVNIPTLATIILYVIRGNKRRFLLGAIIVSGFLAISAITIYISVSVLPLWKSVLLILLNFIIIAWFPAYIFGGLFSREGYGHFFAFGAAFSILYTFISFFVGNISNPIAPIPKTLQMLLINALMDGTTLSFTFFILKWSLKNPMIRIPIAVLIDLLVGAVLACLSLYSGVIWTEQHLSIEQVVRVLAGLYPDPENTGISLGPYFWAMHTAFLPTLAYMTLILVAWLAKAIIGPVGWFLAGAGDSKNPLKYMAALLTVLAVLFGGLATGLGYWEAKVKEEEKASQTLSVLERVVTPSEINPNGSGRDGRPTRSSTW